MEYATLVWKSSDNVLLLLEHALLYVKFWTFIEYELTSAFPITKEAEYSRVIMEEFLKIVYFILHSVLWIAYNLTVKLEDGKILM